MKYFAWLILILPSLGHAAAYDCSLETKTSRTPLFQIDFDKEDSAEKKIAEVGDVGCVALRLYPEVFSCSIAFEPGHSLSAVAEIGSAVLRLQADNKEGMLAVQCSKIY
jgi:hypothetical protein